MKRTYVPTRCVHDWQQLLAKPEEQWKPGFSARCLAHAWEEADGFPSSVESVLRQSFPDIAPLLILPEHRVPLPGGRAASQNDVWVLAKSRGELVSIAVEGKVSEPFGPTVAAWNCDASPGRQKRLAFLKGLLLLSDIPDSIRYQLVHRTASAIIEAERFTAQHAVLLVHSFSPNNERLEDFASFVSLFGGAAHVDRTIRAGGSRTPSLSFAWVHGDERYLMR